jgi:glycosyltransferase involved in cell wall biosynthesis
MIAGGSDQRDRNYRIAILAETFPPAGGGVPAAHYALYQLLKRQHVVRLFAFADRRPSNAEIIRSHGIGWVTKIASRLAALYVSRFDQAGGSPESQRIASTAAAILRLNRKLARFRPEIVFVPDFAAPGLGLMRPKGARLVWMAHHNYRRFDNIPVLPLPGWYDNYLAHRLERRALRKFDYAIFPSRYMERVFRETLDPDMRGRVIPHSPLVDTPEIQSRSAIREELGLGDEAILVYIPSGGTAAKGERYVFEIVRRLKAAAPDVRFFLSGEISPRLSAELSSVLPPESVLAPGRIPLNENLRYTRAADIAVSPTLVENFSCALLEAQTLGIPCVTFDTGGNTELVQNGETGYVVPYLDVEALVTRSIEVMTDPQLRQRMASQARARAAAQSDAQLIRQSYEEVMEECMATEARAR